MEFEKEEPIAQRKHDACRKCGIDADCVPVNQITGLCGVCEKH